MAECFIICPLDEEGSAVRKRSDTILKHLISPVLKELSYDVIRADQIPKAGLITTQVINLIIESPLVIADLTGGNPNVFYELAIRHASRKPYIQIIEKGDRIPFDIGTVRTIEVDSHSLDSVESAKDQISRHVKEFEKGHAPDSPISVATSMRLLQEDEEFAEAIAQRIAYISDDYDYDYSQTLAIEEEIDRMTAGGRISLIDLDRKLDIIRRLFDEIISENTDNDLSSK